LKLRSDQPDSYKGVLILESTSNIYSNVSFQMTDINIVDALTPQVLEIDGFIQAIEIPASNVVSNVYSLQIDTHAPAWPVDKYSIYKYTGFTPQYGYVNNAGPATIESVELTIGNQVVESFSGEYIYLHTRTTVSESDRALNSRLMGITDDFMLKNHNPLATNDVSDIANGWEANLPPIVEGVDTYVQSANVESAFTTSNIWFPYGQQYNLDALKTDGLYPRKHVMLLPFGFSDNLNKALPMCAINKQEFGINIKFRDYHSLLYNVYGKIDTTDSRIDPKVKKMTNVRLKIEYAFLGDPELNYIIHRPVDMVIKQVQLNEFKVPKKEFDKSYTDMVFEDFRQNYASIWKDYYNNQTFQLEFNNNINRLYFITQNEEYAKTPRDGSPSGWYGNQWFNYTPDTTDYLFKIRPNNAQRQLNKGKESSQITYNVRYSDPTTAGNSWVSTPWNLEPRSYASSETQISSNITAGFMTWIKPQTVDGKTVSLTSNFADPQIGPISAKQYMIFSEVDTNGNTNPDWWAAIHQYDWLRITVTIKRAATNTRAYTENPYNTYDFTFDNEVHPVGIDGANGHYYITVSDINDRNPNWWWWYKSAVPWWTYNNRIDINSQQIEITVGNYLDKGVFMKNTTDWPYFSQIYDLQLEFNSEIIIPREIADQQFLTSVQTLSYDTTLPYQITNINECRQGPLQLMTLLPITGDGRLGYAFQNEQEFKVPFVENICKYDFGLDNPLNTLYPMGQVNMSRVQHISLNVNFMPSKSNRDFRVYAESYNVLRINNGVAKLLFTSTQ